jgi:hypothetical protein
MAVCEETAFSRRFHHELERTRERIETLPEGQRACFRALADEVGRQHERMEENCARIRNAVSDISLIVENTKFTVWAFEQQGRHPK